MAVGEIKPGEDQARSLQEMVGAHYDEPLLKMLEKDIYYDDILSRAEITTALAAYRLYVSSTVPSNVYLPFAGTLRHAGPLFAHGVSRAVAVDLSKGSLDEGLTHYGDTTFADGTTIRDRVAIHNTNICNTREFVPEGGFTFAIAMGNSFGDPTNWEDHLQVVQALADALGEGGAFVFDYVGDRYKPGLDGQVQEASWPEVFVHPDEGRVPAIDIRTRVFEPSSDVPGVGVLNFTCEIRRAQADGSRGEVIVPRHRYQKLVVPDELLIQQFAAVGLRLMKVGRMVELSEHHAWRDDLGMMGEPNDLYIAIKDSTLLPERSRYASFT